MQTQKRLNHCYYIKGQTNIIDIADSEGVPSYSQSKDELLREYPEAEFRLFDDVLDEIDAINKSRYLDCPPVEITEQEFMEMLGVLPPLHWRTSSGSESFFLSEAMTDRIHSVFARVQDKYFRLYAKRGTKHEEIIERILPVYRAKN